MRVSTHKTDPGYANWRGRQFEVRVDGRVLTNCITADEEGGWAAYHVVDQLGKAVLLDREPVTRTARGRVQIIDITDAKRFTDWSPVEASTDRIPTRRADERPVKIAVAPDVMVRDLR